MPRLSVWYVRSAFVNLVLGATFGALMLTAKAAPTWGWAWALFQSHIEVIAFGWMLQFVMGIAFWALPRYKEPPKRGDERPVWIAWALINIGVWLIALSPWLGSPWARTIGAGCEVVAVVLFALHAWPRVKPLGT